MFFGSIPAIITPFKKGSIDMEALEQFIEWQIEQGSHGIVTCGTTGEAPTLSHDEHIDILKLCVAVVKRRIPIIAGTGSNCTAKTIEMTKIAKDLGATASLIVAPYYNKPTQEGLFTHYKAINDSVDLPIIIYNIPARSSVDIHNDTLARLAVFPNIVGIKDATGDLSRPSIIQSTIGDDFCQLSGEDSTAAAFLAQGGHGCISVSANIAPSACSALQNAWQNNDMKLFTQIRDLLAPLHQALFYESSPSPVKYAAHKLSLCTDEVRLPLLPASAPCRKIIDQVIIKTGLISENGDPIVQAYG